MMNCKMPMGYLRPGFMSFSHVIPQDFNDLENILSDLRREKMQTDFMKVDNFEGGSKRIRFFVPGLQKNDIKIQLEDGILQVDGDNEDYEYELVTAIDMKKYDAPAEATIQDGVLTLIFPKAKERLPKKITVL